MPLVQHIHEVLMSEMSSAGVYLLRLVLAAFLGGAIGLEREIKHRPAGLRTNLFICVGAAMFTLLSDALAVRYLGDHTRIAAQIIPGIGFIGAGSILHNRDNLVTGITSAATLFVVASVGMAVGGGLYSRRFSPPRSFCFACSCWEMPSRNSISSWQCTATK